MMNKLLEKTVRYIKTVVRPNVQEHFLKARKKILARLKSDSILDQLVILYYSNKIAKLNRTYNSSLAVTEYGINETTQFPHGFAGIFVSSGARIGNNVVIYQQCTIGSNTLRNSKRGGVPSIGNNVIIGAGAKIIGGVSVGDNVRIGANCIVVKDVPDNATIVLSEPRVVIHDEARDNKRGLWRDFTS